MKVTIDREKNSVTIELPLESTGTRTKKGTANLIATTRGTVRVSANDAKTGQPVGEYKVGVNVTQ